MRADFFIYDRHDRLTIAVAIRGFEQMDAELAKELLPNILNRGEAPPYLILVTHDRTYFWTDPAHRETPSFMIPTDLLLEKSLQQLGKSAATVHYSTLGLMMFDWLAQFTNQRIEVPADLQAIGFHDAICGGRIELEAAA